MGIRTVLLSSSVLMMGGCSVLDRDTAPRLPIPKSDELKTFNEMYERRLKGKPADAELSTLQTALAEFHTNLYINATSRIKTRWENGDMTTFGGLGAVAGAVAEKAALTNIGAAIAILGTVSTSHYQVNTQVASYTTALRQVSCISGKVNSLRNYDLNAAKKITGDDATVAVANSFVRDAVAAVDTVRQTYLNSLLGISPSVPSQAELAAHFSTYRPGNSTVSEMQTAAGNAEDVLTDIERINEEIASLEGNNPGVKSAEIAKRISDLKKTLQERKDALSGIRAQLKAMAAAQQANNELAKAAGERVKALSAEIQNCSKI